LKENAHEIAPIFCAILNTCLRKGHFPNSWKTALVTPILKPNSPKSSPDSYRPISILTHFSKTFESLLSRRLNDFSKTQGILNKQQFGFRSKHSTFHALTDLTQSIFKSLEKGKVTIGVYVDLFRAFDGVPHITLMNKLMSKYSFPPDLCRILASYFHERFIKVKIGKFLSNAFPLFASVVQGSKLGPFLFNLFINDLFDVMQGNSDLYCDDIACITSTDSEESAIRDVKAKLTVINAWCSANSMKINWSKSFFMFYYNKHSKNTPSNISEIDTGVFTIKRVKEFKYLGVWLDESLDFKTHAAKMIKKVNPRIFFLLRLKHFIPTKKAPHNKKSPTSF
jgi:hypothetical protein